jgi:orotate phosphoribosyltransferase
MIDWAAAGISIEAVPNASRGPEQLTADLARDLIAASERRGDFVLSSGLRSDRFVDKYLFATNPGILRRVASALAETVPADCDRLAATAFGAVPIATALSLETGLPFVIVHDDGEAVARIDGELHDGEAVVLVEDVLATGTRANRATDRLAALGATVLRVLAVIDRGEGGLERLLAAGLDARAIVRLEVPETEVS